MKNRKIQRVESILEYEFSWRGTNLLRERLLCNEGFWILKNGICTHGSLKCPDISQPNRVSIKKQANYLRNLLPSFSDIKIIWINRRKSINKKTYSQWGWYFEVKLGSNINTLILPCKATDTLRCEAIEVRLLEWASDVLGFMNLPLVSRNFQTDIIEFSSQALGCFFHEALGHAMENPEFKTKTDLKCRFNIEDGPGDPTLWGFCPFDDFGTKGKKVILLAGRKGKTNTLSPESGNMRSTGWGWHPIVRQRCLLVKALAICPLPKKRSKIILGEVQMGAWDDESQIVDIISTRATLILRNGKKFRLPTLKLTLSIECLRFLRPFGKSQSYNPGGGCHKDLQRGLPVSFTAPSAWLDLAKLPKNSLELNL